MYLFDMERRRTNDYDDDFKAIIEIRLEKTSIYRISTPVYPKTAKKLIANYFKAQFPIIKIRHVYFILLNLDFKNNNDT